MQSDRIQDLGCDRMQSDRIQGIGHDRIQGIGHDRMQDDRIPKDRMTLKDRMQDRIGNLLNNAVMGIVNQSLVEKKDREVFNEHLVGVYKRVDTIVSNQYRLKYGSYNRGKGSFQDFNGNILTDYYEVGQVNITVNIEGHHEVWSYKLLSRSESSCNVPIKLRVHYIYELDYIFIHRVCTQLNNQEYSIYNELGNLIVNEYNNERNTKRYINNFIDTYIKTG